MRPGLRLIVSERVPGLYPAERRAAHTAYISRKLI